MHILIFDRNYEQQTTTKEDASAMVAGKLAHSDSLISEVALASKAILRVLASQRATQEVDFSASLPLRLLHLEPLSQHRLALVPAEVYLVLSRTSQLRVTYSEPRRLPSRVRVSLALREILQADLAPLVVRSAVEEGACLGTTTNNSSSSRSRCLAVIPLLLQVALDKATMRLVPIPPTTMLVVVSSAIRPLRTTPRLDKRSNSRHNQTLSVALVNRKTKIRLIAIRHLVDLANRNNRSRSRFSAASSQQQIPEEVFSETLARITTSNSLLGGAYLGVPTTISRLQVLYLHQSQPLQVQGSLGTRIRLIRIQEAGCSGTWGTTTPIKLSKTKVEDSLETTARISKSLVSSETPRTPEVAFLAMWATIIINNKEAVPFSETVNSSSRKVVVSSATPTTTITRVPASLDHSSSSPSSNLTCLHPHHSLTPLSWIPIAHTGAPRYSLACLLHHKSWVLLPHRSTSSKS